GAVSDLCYLADADCCIPVDTAPVRVRCRRSRPHPHDRGRQVLARIGSNPDGTKCTGPGGTHSSATGLRLYYDAASRGSRFGVGFRPEPVIDRFLHANGGACRNGPGPSVTSQFLDEDSPGSGTPKCLDSRGVSFVRGNPWQEIGTWSMTVR